jgi:hypothetical protein
MDPSTFHSAPHLTSSSFRQLSKHQRLIFSIDGGSETEASDEQRENAKSPSSAILLPSKVTVDRCEHSSKQYAAIVSTDGGMQIDSSDKHPQNADRPRVAILQQLSNATLDKRPHLLKQ